MLAFNACNDDGSLELVIFAACTDQAAALFCEAHLAQHGTMPPAFTVKRRTIGNEVNKKALRQALRQEQVGVAKLIMDRWVVEPLVGEGF